MKRSVATVQCSGVQCNKSSVLYTKRTAQCSLVLWSTAYQLYSAVPWTKSTLQSEYSVVSNVFTFRPTLSPVGQVLVMLLYQQQQLATWEGEGEEEERSGGGRTNERKAVEKKEGRRNKVLAGQTMALKLIWTIMQTKENYVHIVHFVNKREQSSR